MKPERITHPSPHATAMQKLHVATDAVKCSGSIGFPLLAIFLQLRMCLQGPERAATIVFLPS